MTEDSSPVTRAEFNQLLKMIKELTNTNTKAMRVYRKGFTDVHKALAYFRESIDGIDRRLDNLERRIGELDTRLGKETTT